MASSDSNARRVVGFIDMDAFYIAVEMQGPFKAQLHGKPAAVVQYNSGAYELSGVLAPSRFPSSRFFLHPLSLSLPAPPPPEKLFSLANRLVKEII